jgi:oxidase EvaA
MISTPSAKIISIEQLVGWELDDKLNIRHRSGGFYSFQAIRPYAGEDQPKGIRIVQNEIGLLLSFISSTKTNALATKISVQRKFEPGNDPIYQLSPSIQKTYSNFRGLHGGKPFDAASILSKRGFSVFSMTAQSEQSDSYLHKKNLNVLIEIEEDRLLECAPSNSCWLEVRQLCRAILAGKKIHIDLRSTAFPLLLRLCTSRGCSNPSTRSGESVDLVQALARFSLTNQRPWVYADMIDCCKLEGGKIRLQSEDDVSIVGVEVHAPDREVSTWTQPLLCIKPKTFILSYGYKDGKVYILSAMCMSPGLITEAELMPTFTLPQDSHAYESSNIWRAGHLIHQSVQTEEGGRFWQRYNNYLIYETEVRESSDSQKWISLECLMEVYNSTAAISIELRSACTLLLSHLLMQ